MSRWIAFFLAILVGVAGGLLYGWVLSPVKYVDTTPDSLRIDYKSDYVLMVAEAYQLEADLSLAARRLAQLGASPPVELVRQAVLFGERQAYTDADLALMRRLETDLQGWTPPAETRAP
jgi:hypothetical protein